MKYVEENIVGNVTTRKIYEAETVEQLKQLVENIGGIEKTGTTINVNGSLNNSELKCKCSTKTTSKNTNDIRLRDISTEDLLKGICMRPIPKDLEEKQNIRSYIERIVDSYNRNFVGVC